MAVTEDPDNGGGPLSGEPRRPAGPAGDGVLAVAANPLVADSVGEYTRAWLKRVRGGDSGVLPVVAGLVVIVVIFQSQASEFLSVRNIVNLFSQAAVFVLLGLAETFALLLSEIDLSVGYVAGVGAVVVAMLIEPPYNWPWWAGILFGLAATGLYGALQGTLITRLRLPSFVVTLAGLLGMEGVLIYLVDNAKAGTGGTIRITDPVVNDLVNGNMSPLAGWLVMITAVALFAGLSLRRDARRRARGLAAPLPALTAAKIVLLAAAGAVLVLIGNANRGSLAVTLSGVPWVVPLVIAIIVLWSVLLERTRFGRSVYAIGGNAEAARRAGINVALIRTLCFALAGLTAGIAGVVYESRLGSISANLNGGTLVLYAVAAAVIGGTSLFGGRGRAVDALLGGVVIAAIYNGLGLLGVSAAVTYMVTALVLLAAVIVDRLARRGGTT
ncbi:MAG: sugar ABC transporter permease [Acidimicrobiales bacterium]